LPVPIQNLAMTEIVGSSSPRVGSDAPLLEQQSRFVDNAYRLHDEAEPLHRGSEGSEGLDWSELPLEDDLLDLLAGDGSRAH